MNELKVIGKEHVGKYEFTGIEGGFGDDKKAMLVSDIASIHGKTVKAINQAINMNRTRFKDGLDVIDLKTESGSINLTEFFSKQQIANFNNIYLLSERGYAKLLKILEDDTAWEIYDQLVDNYFGLRQAVRENQPSLIAGKRLEIMEKNAASRKANLLYKIAMATVSNSSKEQLLANAAKELTGEMVIPDLKRKEYSAGDIGGLLGISANRVGRISTKLGLKADQPGQNKYGRWAASKAQHNASERPTWIYFEAGLKAIQEVLTEK